MKSILKNLATDENLLLMYLANELPPEDRAQVESRLKRDAALRAKLDTLIETYGVVQATFGVADSGHVMPSPFVAAHALSDAARQRQSMPDTADTFRIKPAPAGVWRFYTAGAAAVATIGISMWWLVSLQMNRQVASDPYDFPVDPNPSFSGWDVSGLHGRMLIPPPAVEKGATSIADRDLASMFDPLVPDNSASLEQQLVAMQYVHDAAQ